jgi:MoaA/NifB/PqqE/SkfB family radical SAM enzyme
MFSALGEPLLHPRFSEACHLVKRFGYHLIVTTNGSLLKEEYKNLPIDELYISLQTPTKRSFKLRNAGNLKFEDYLNNICDFAKEVPYFTSLYLLTENKLAFPNYKDFISKQNKEKSFKIIEKIGKKINPHFKINLGKNDNLPRFINISHHVYFYFKHLVARKNCWVPRHLKLEEARSIPNCGYYKHHINILSNGEITVCCSDYDGELSLGNIKKESLKKIYFRKERNIDLAKFPFCKKCMGRLVPK